VIWRLNNKKGISAVYTGTIRDISFQTVAMGGGGDIEAVDL
jgi:hypothetical protein